MILDIRERLKIVQGGFLEKGRYGSLLEMRMKLTRAQRERLTIFVIVGMRTGEHSLRSQVGIGSESDCLLGQLERIL